MTMTLSNDICLLLVREIEGFVREVESFPDEALLWQVVPGVTNSAGNLAMHVAGNLQHFIGGQLGGSSFVRNREAELSERSASRQDIVTALRTAIDEVRRVVPGLDETALQQMMPNAPLGLRLPTGRFLLHLVAHTAFHLGQAGYLRRIVTGDPTSARPLPLDVLALAD
jgi:hypothetical protein